MQWAAITGDEYSIERYAEGSTYKMANALKYGQIEIPNIPEDEPVFVLRAQDILSLPTIAEYRKMCMGAGCERTHLAAVDDVHAAIREWQNGDNRIKVPDSLPANAPNTVPMFQS